MEPCVMAIFAHPDDELDIGGILAASAQEGAQVVLVCATPGDQGGTRDPSLATRETLGQVRSEELRCCCRRLGIQHLYVGLVGDSGWRTPNPPPGSLVCARPPELIGRLVTLIRRHRPQVIFTFGPDGIYGHRDHVAIGAYATSAFWAAGEEGIYPEAGDPWRARRLYYIALPELQRKVLVHDATIVQIGQVTHTFDVERYIEAKEEGEQCHRTQGPYFPAIAEALPPDEYRRAVGTECLMLVAERPPAPGEGEAPMQGILGQLLAS